MKIVRSYPTAIAEPADFIHKLKLAQKELKESRVWLLFASRLSPGPTVDALRAESRELLLMIGKSINTAVARSQGKPIGAQARRLRGPFGEEAVLMRWPYPLDFCRRKSV